MRRHGAAGCLVVALLALVPAVGWAEETLEYGAKGGLNISMVRGEGGFDSKLGALGGGFVCYDFNTDFGIESGLYFTMKGAKLEPGASLPTQLPPAATGGDAFYILDYLEVPILLRYNVPDVAGGVVPHLYAGPWLAFKVDARQRDSAGNSSDLDDVRTLDSGIAFGVSADFPVGVRKFILDVRYGLGLTDAFENDAQNLKNDSFTIMAGLQF